MGTVKPGGSSSWSASCFNSTSVALTPNANGTGGIVTFTGSQPTTLLCSDVYLLMTNFHVRRREWGGFFSLCIGLIP